MERVAEREGRLRREGVGREERRKREGKGEVKRGNWEKKKEGEDGRAREGDGDGDGDGSTEELLKKESSVWPVAQMGADVQGAVSSS